MIKEHSVTMVTTTIMGFRAKLGNLWSLRNHVGPPKQVP